ncbi:MAG: DUF5979 domain-containing protein, partial [Actinomycetaceae bacterium]
TKDIEGPGAALYGAGPFEAQVDCTWAPNGVTTPIALPDDGRVVLDADNGYVAAVDGLPDGATCVVTETLTGGADATATIPADGTVVIDGDDETVTEVTLVNTFEVTSLVVTKAVEGPAPEGSTFTVDLQCTRVVDGAEQDVAIPGGSERDLTLDDLTAVYEDLPLGATCVVTETGTGGADDTSITVTGADGETATTLGTTAGLVLSEDGTEVEVLVTNEFDEIPPTEPADPADPTDPPSGGGSDGPLPDTGFDAADLAMIAGLLLLTGGAIAIGARRRANN